MSLRWGRIGLLAGIILAIIASAAILTGTVQLPSIGSNEPAPIKLGANETIVGYTPAGAPIIGEKNQSQQNVVTLPVTVSEVDKQDNPEQPAGLPATTWNWAGRTASWANVLSKTEPTSFSYAGDTYTIYIPENDFLRSITSFEELNEAWLAVYGPGTGYKFSDSGSGPNGFFAQMVRTGNVQVYQGPLDNYGKRNLIFPYPWGTEGITKYTFVGKNAQGSLERYELKLSDFENVKYANQPDEPAPADEPATEIKPEVTETKSEVTTPTSAEEVSAGRSTTSSTPSSTPSSSADVAKGRK